MGYSTVSGMTHRWRVQTALDHEEPDCVPLDLGTGGNSAPVPEMYERLMGLYGLRSEVRLVPHMLRLAVVDEEILQDLDIDTRAVSMRPVRHGLRPCNQPGQFYDDWGVLWKEIDAGVATYRELSEFPLADAGLDDLVRYPWWPDPLDPVPYDGVEQDAKRLFFDTEWAVVGCPSFNGVWERATYLCGFRRMLEGLLIEPEFVHGLLRRITDLCKLALGRYLDLVGPYLQIIKMGDDLGTQNGPQMSPKSYRDVIKPYHQELFAFIKERTEARIFLHTCGSVYRLLPDLIDAGVEILNPVQVSAKDMDTRRLKAEFGDRLTFMGAIDTQRVLPFGSVEEVQAEVEQRIAHLGPGGGYILAPVHNVQADVPPENLLAMYRHARQVGRYPLPRGVSQG
jgi:uroporphyrinogen decarboxylase